MASLVPSEAQLQATVVELAGWRQWGCYHTFDARRSREGFPDLTLWRDRVVFAELKRQGEKPRPSQRAVLDGLAAAGAEVYVWTLDDLAEIQRVMSRRWRFVPYGTAVDRAGAVLPGPRLVDGTVSFAPRSAWIPGEGRRG